MRVAFHAPLKPPDHPVPSGDRRMARSFVELLAGLGHEVELACHFRSYDRNGDVARQERLEALGASLAVGLVRRYRRRPPERRPQLWFTYHLYHKAPDWLGPPVTGALAIPYVVAEGSIAGKQAGGRWAAGHAASRAAIGRADSVLAMTQADLPGLADAVGERRKLRLFPPFLDTGPFVAAAGTRAAARAQLAAEWRLGAGLPWLLAVAMMRADAKALSYRLLAQALNGLADLPWQLLIVGDGEARSEVSALFGRFGDRVRLLGALPAAALPSVYAAADLYVWPACNEAYGMALLEAQSAGVPVVAGAEGGVADVVVHGHAGLLVEPRQPVAMATAVRALLTDPARRRSMGCAAQARVVAWHDRQMARERLAEALDGLGTSTGRGRCASA